MRPLRILHSEAATSFGGQENRIFKEMVAMRHRGHEIEALCQPQAQLVPRLQDKGFVVHTMEMDGPANYLRCLWRLVPLMRAKRYDVVNTHSRRDTMIAAAAGRLAGVPLIVRTRHLASKIGSLASYTWLPHRVITVSDHVRSMLIEKGVPPDYVATVYSPIPMPPLLKHSTLRQELGLSSDDTVIGCVAVMRAKKGHRTLIDAALPLILSHPNLHLVFVGGGSPVFEQVKAYVAQKGLDHRIHLLGTRSDVPNLLAGFDIFALATEQEASGTVFVEAAAMGLPVVGTRVGGVAEMMRDGETGYLVPLNDIAELTQTLARLVDNPQLRTTMGQAGLQFVRTAEFFTLEGMAKSTEQAYLHWLSARAK